MTRRKKTPPSTASPSQKRVSFEIPASLQHLSTISRSLATNMATTSYNYGDSRNTLKSPPRVANAPSALGQARPSSQSSTHSASSFSNASRPGQYATSSLPQKRSFSEYQSTPPGRKETESSTLAEVMAHARAVVAASKSKSPQVSRVGLPAPVTPNASAANLGGRSIPTNDPNMVAQIAARQREENAKAKVARNAPPALPYIAQEPLLEHGEAPSMATHPNLIAQMVARKRAEAEMHGHRERLARRQQEYRMSSPGAQLTHELDDQVSRYDAQQIQSRTVSNPLPAGSNPTMPPLKPATPIVFAQISTPQNRIPSALNTQLPPSQSSAPTNMNAQTPGVQTPLTETVSTPATDDSLRPPAVNNNRRPSNDNDSLFGSPFSTPIVEFLERATDNAGLREALEPNEIMSNRTSVSTIMAPTSQPSNTENATTSEPADAASRSQAQLDIPRLFSDRPLNTQSQAQNLNVTPSQSQPTATHSQPHFNPYTLSQRQIPQSQYQGGGGGGGPPQLAPRQIPAPPAVPYYPHMAGIPGYYRVELNPNWTGGGHGFIATPSAPAPNPYQRALSPAGVGYNSYLVNASNPYALHHPTIPPAPGALRTYGTVVGAAEHQKQQAPSPGHLTAADTYAGINLKFKHATKKGFSVPKR